MRQTLGQPQPLAQLPAQSPARLLASQGRWPRWLRAGILTAFAVCAGGCQGDLITVGVRRDGPAEDRPASDAFDGALDAPDTQAEGNGAAGAPGPTGMADMTDMTDTTDVTDAAGESDASDDSGDTPGESPIPTADACGVSPLESPRGVTSPRLGGSGRVEYTVDAPNVFLGVRTTLAVPAEPPPDGPIFIWTGVQPTPGVAGFEPIGNGATLSVLAWGLLCPPDAPTAYSTWWAVPMYSNLSSSLPRYAGCHSGDVVLAQPEQRIDIEIRWDGAAWVQSIANRNAMTGSDFRIDLSGQDQGRLFFNLALQTDNKPTEDIVFTDTVLTMDLADPAACEPLNQGDNDFVSMPRVSADGRHCCIDRIVLRAPGSPATTTDPPAETRP